MRIGYDISQTGASKAGCGYLSDSLIRHLAEIDRQNDYILYPSFGDHYFDPEMPDNCVVIRKNNIQYGLCHRQLSKAQEFWRQPQKDFEAQLGNPDVIHANNFYCPSGLRHAKLVYTLYDLGFIENPEWTTEANRVACFDGVFNASLYADLIVAISEYSRKHFLKIFPHYPENKVAVVHLASRFSSQKSIKKPISLDALQPGRYWLNVGTLEPRKNHMRLLNAYAKLKAFNSNTFPLVIAGGKGWMLENFNDQIKSLGLYEDIIQLGYINDTELQWLYHNCFCMVYPSLFEGFGLPVLEALSQGAAVITSNTSSIPEIIGNAGIMVDPYDEDAILHAMHRLMTGEVNRETLREMAILRAANFSWEISAKKVLILYQTLVNTVANSETALHI
ncbi:MAG: glycosyltransferase family 4 protein [Sulfuricaulis sp.]